MAPATTTTKKPAARRTAAPKAAAAPAEHEHTDPPPAEDTEPKPPPELDPDGGNGDVLVIPVGKKAPEPEDPGPVIEVFRYGAKAYSMPVEVTAQVAMHATWVMKTHGTLTGGMQIVERLLGPEALHVLLTAKEIEDEHIFAVITKVTKHVWGRAEEALGE